MMYPVDWVAKKGWRIGRSVLRGEEGGVALGTIKS
jgi:hypothetical protein